jgi:hypothetical protein
LIDRKEVLDLDDYGFPVVSLANHLLVQQTDFGESREALEKNWQTWLHHNPFDAPVARRLSELFARHLSQLDPKSDSGEVRRLERKLHQTQDRAKRYAAEAFEP